MPLATSLDQLTSDLTTAQQATLQRGDVVLSGQDGHYSVWAILQASVETAWEVLTAYEHFPDFLPSVVSSRILERRDNCVLIERKDRRKIGWMPIKVKIVTENIESYPERIDYRMVEGTLDAMKGAWKLSTTVDQADRNVTLLVQEIAAKASMGPLQSYFYEVFEKGLVDTMTDLRQEIERRDRA